MQVTLLPVAVMNVQHELDLAFPAVLHSPPEFDQRLTLCDLFRQLAVGSLLLTADPRLFFTYLHRSARAFLDVLGRVPRDRTLASRFTPFLDAVAGGDTEAALQIAEAAPDEPKVAREYEEDFLYMKLLMSFTPGSGTDRVERWLDRFRELHGTSPDLRLAVCEALWEKDNAALEEAVDAAATAYREELGRAMEEEEIDPDEAAVASISVEVLAWMELARTRGLQTKGAHPSAPAVARAFHMVPPVDPVGWRLGRAGV